VARYFTGTDSVKQLYFSVRSMEEVPDASKEIIRIISARHKPSSVYKAQNLKELLTTAAVIANALTAVLVLVATVTLAVGGVGIMNIMLANVRARIREIGIRKALGATYREIKLQFLAEAVIISLTGGVVGTIVGLALPLSVRLFTDYKLPISIWSVVIALAAAVLVGVIFGTVPATRAAQMDPVESLKYE
jgi:putative ABC transport system permease protein